MAVGEECLVFWAVEPFFLWFVSWVACLGDEHALSHLLRALSVVHELIGDQVRFPVAIDYSGDDWMVVQRVNEEALLALDFPWL